MPSILVVDDCLPIASILARHLSKAGHKVSIATNGAEALDRIAAEAPDCIVADLLMPVMTGHELVHALKSDPTTADIPVVLVSSRVGDGRSHIFPDYDPNYCVGKPFNGRQVLDAIGAALAA